MIQLVTLLGTKSAAYEWSLPCLRSWHRIAGQSRPIWFISDGTLPDEFSSLIPGINARGSPKQQEETVQAFLSKYPSLRAIRHRDFSWRKLLDVSLFLPQGSDHCLYLDSDVYIRRRVEFEHTGGLTYMREDIPAYLGSWIAPLREEMVLSFNSGCVAFQPRLIDFEFLEHVAQRYVLPMRRTWWSEQLAWSLLAGRQPNRSFWCGRQARVVSGCGTRSSEEISSNIVKFISRRDYISSEEQMAEYCGHAAVIHMAGMGKQFFRSLLPGSDAPAKTFVRAVPDTPVSSKQAMLIAGRLAAKSIQGRLRKFHEA